MPADYVRERFTITKSNKYYAKMAENTKIIGIWDDHDFGSNNEGKDFSLKHQNRDLFLDFVDEPAASERRL
jgi:alkaline phosphatase D